MPCGLKEARGALITEGEEEEDDDETDAIVEGPTTTLVWSLLKKAHHKKGATITSGSAADTPHCPALPPKPKRQVPSFALAEQREDPSLFLKT